MSVTNITAENFNTEVLESEKPVLLDFWAPWCGPCRMFSSTVDSVAEERNDIKVGKINIDENIDLANQHSHPCPCPGWQEESLQYRPSLQKRRSQNAGCLRTPNHLLSG